MIVGREKFIGIGCNGNRLIYCDAVWFKIHVFPALPDELFHYTNSQPRGLCLISPPIKGLAKPYVDFSDLWSTYFREMLVDCRLIKKIDQRFVKLTTQLSWYKNISLFWIVSELRTMELRMRHAKLQSEGHQQQTNTELKQAVGGKSPPPLYAARWGPAPAHARLTPGLRNPAHLASSSWVPWIFMLWPSASSYTPYAWPAAPSTPCFQKLWAPWIFMR